MNKTEICIRLLQILNTGRTYKIDELVDLLNEDNFTTTNRRNVLQYKKELEECGFPIESVAGPYGGYRLSKTEMMPSMLLNDAEKNALHEALSYISSHGDFPSKDSFVMALSKVFSSTSMKATTPGYLYGTRQLQEPIDESMPTFLTLQKAIDKREYVTLDYLGYDCKKRSKRVEPYALFSQDGAWILLCYNQEDRSYKYYKLKRISNLAETNKPFPYDPYFNIHDYVDEFGMKYGMETTHVRFRLVGAAKRYAIDYVFGKNQVNTVNDDGSVTIDVDIRFITSAVRQIVSFLGECEVLEPQWLAEKIKEVGKAIASNKATPHDIPVWKGNDEIRD